MKFDFNFLTGHNSEGLSFSHFRKLFSKWQNILMNCVCLGFENQHNKSTGSLIDTL